MTVWLYQGINQKSVWPHDYRFLFTGWCKNGMIARAEVRISKTHLGQRFDKDIEKQPST